MLDRKVIEEFLFEEIEEKSIPRRINKQELVEAFCQFVEADYYEWLRDNSNSFLNHGNPDWEWIEKFIQVRCNKK